MSLVLLINYINYDFDNLTFLCEETSFINRSPDSHNLSHIFKIISAYFLSISLVPKPHTKEKHSD